MTVALDNVTLVNVVCDIPQRLSFGEDCSDLVIVCNLHCHKRPSCVDMGRSWFVQMLQGKEEESAQFLPNPKTQRNV